MALTILTRLPYDGIVPTTLKLRTITDLVRVAPQLKAGLGYEFIQRSDGLPGLEKYYGLKFGEVVGMQQSLKYQATDKGDVDLLDVYTTDGRLAVYDFVVLEDDRQFFPPYDATALVRGETLKQHPELGQILSLLTNALSPERMRELNLRIQEQGEAIPQVAYDALHALHLVKEGHQPTTATINKSTSFLSYMWEQTSDVDGSDRRTFGAGWHGFTARHCVGHSTGLHT